MLSALSPAQVQALNSLISSYNGPLPPGRMHLPPQNGTGNWSTDSWLNSPPFDGNWNGTNGTVTLPWQQPLNNGSNGFGALFPLPIPIPGPGAAPWLTSPPNGSWSGNYSNPGDYFYGTGGTPPPFIGNWTYNERGALLGMFNNTAGILNGSRSEIFNRTSLPSPPFNGSWSDLLNGTGGNLSWSGLPLYNGNWNSSDLFPVLNGSWNDILNATGPYPGLLPSIFNGTWNGTLPDIFNGTSGPGLIPLPILLNGNGSPWLNISGSWNGTGPPPWLGRPPQQDPSQRRRGCHWNSTDVDVFLNETGAPPDWVAKFLSESNETDFEEEEEGCGGFRDSRSVSL